VDNELSEEDKIETEKFVLQNPQLQQAFTLMKQAVLPQEKIEYTEKEKFIP